MDYYDEIAKIIEGESEKQNIEKDELTKSLIRYIKKNLSQF